MRETPLDHDYCKNGRSDKNNKEKNKGQSVSFSSDSSGKKFIHSTKDLQKQNEIVAKRFKAKIFKRNDESYECRSCSDLFVSYVSALRHVKTAKCESGKRKKQPKTIKCQEDGCDIEFNYKKVLFPIIYF